MLHFVSNGCSFWYVLHFASNGIGSNGCSFWYVLHFVSNGCAYAQCIPKRPGSHSVTTARSRGAHHRVTWNASVMPSVAAQDAAADTKAATASRHKRELAAHGYAFVALKRDFVRPLPPPARPAQPSRCAALSWPRGCCSCPSGCSSASCPRGCCCCSSCLPARPAQPSCCAALSWPRG